VVPSTTEDHSSTWALEVEGDAIVGVQSYACVHARRASNSGAHHAIRLWPRLAGQATARAHLSDANFNVGPLGKKVDDMVR